MKYLEINANKIEFSNDDGVTRLLKKSSWGGTLPEIPCWGDFDSNYFQLSGNKIQYRLTPPVPAYAQIYQGSLGNVNNQTINVCGIRVADAFSRGEYHHEIRFQKTVNNWAFPITIDFYCDTQRLADAKTFTRYDGADNDIVVGYITQSNVGYLILGLYSNNAQCKITSLATYPAAQVLSVNYEPTPHSYYVI